MGKLEPVLLLILGAMVFFTLVLVASEVFFKDDSQLFQVIAGLLTALTGAFLGRVKPSPDKTTETKTDAPESAK